MPPEENKILFPAELFASRVIVVLETGPQSNEYRQVLLNSEQFALMTQFFRQILPSCDNLLHQHKGNERCMDVPVSDEIIAGLPEEIQTYYAPKKRS